MKRKNQRGSDPQRLFGVRPLWIFFFVLLLPVPAFAESTALTDVPPMPEGTVLFDAEARFAERGRIGGYAMKPSKYGVYPDSKVRREGSSEEAIFFRYRKLPNPSFCGAYLIVLGDLSSYATMTFWVRGAKGGEAFELGLNDTISNKREDAVLAGSIHRYLPHGVTTEWQQAKVPLEDFFGADLSRTYSVVFNFNETGEGDFWIDGLEFHKEVLVDRDSEILSRGELLLDNFDHSNLNLLGRKANAYKRLPSVCEFSRVISKPVPGTGTVPGTEQTNRSLRLGFDKKATGWCGYYTLLNQIDGAYYDLSAYKAVRFWVRGEAGGEVFEIGMADRSWLTIGDSVKAGPIEKYLPSGVTPPPLGGDSPKVSRLRPEAEGAPLGETPSGGAPRGGGVTAEWQEVVIPLTDFGKLDWTQMGSFVINFHKQGRGAVFIDNLRFIRKGEEDLLKEWEEGA